MTTTDTIAVLAEPVVAEKPKARHSLAVRVTHWVNVVCFVFLVWSGVAILIAYPRMHWGDQGYLQMAAALELPIKLDTQYSNWGRQMHFAFAWLFLINGALYLASGLLSKHLKRDIAPAIKDLAPRRLGAEFLHQIKGGKHGEDAAGYNPFQRIAYTALIFVLLPAMWVTGLAMSPAFVAWAPWLTELLTGRQSARFLHFIGAVLIVAFVAVHLFKVMTTGFGRQVTAMITGRFPSAKTEPEA